MERRLFLKRVLEGVAVALAAPAVATAVAEPSLPGTPDTATPAATAPIATTKKVAISLVKLDKLKEPGGWTIIKVKEEEILLIRISAKEIAAVSALCTHQKCRLKYKDSKKKIQCKCHRSTFSLKGKALNGPAKADLKDYQAVLDGETVILTMGE